METAIHNILSLLRSPDSNNHELALALMQSQGVQKEIFEIVFPATDFVWVEGGSFEMGSSRDAPPVHTVTLSGFYMQNTPVTQLQYFLVMGINPSGFLGCSDCPVENITWYDAVEFCNRLSEMMGREPFYTIDKDHKDENNTNDYDNLSWSVTCNGNANGYCLPTEAEWEYAAKGGAKSKGYEYAGSNELDEVAWWYRNSENKTHPVKKKKPNELGLYDMSGNVYEWCWDWYGDYSSNTASNPQGANSGARRVLRGGCWKNYDGYMFRSAFRHVNYLSYANYTMGFRLAVRSSVF